MDESKNHRYKSGALTTTRCGTGNFADKKIIYTYTANHVIVKEVTNILLENV